MGARAFVVNNSIVPGQGVSPDSTHGQSLIAEELVHAISARQSESRVVPNETEASKAEEKEAELIDRFILGPRPKVFIGL